MKKKSIFYSIFIIITTITTIIIYSQQNALPIQENIIFTIKFLGTISLLLISNLLITTSNILTKSIHKKNLLRINLIFLSTLLTFSIIQRIKELNSKIIIPILLIQTTLYLTLFIFNIRLLTNLRRLTQKLYLKSNKNQ